IERKGCRFVGKLHGTGQSIRLRKSAKVTDLEACGRWRRDHSDRSAVHLGIRSAEHFVSSHDPFQASLQERRVEAPLQSQGYRDVIGGTLRIELVQEPEALLGEGERGGHSAFPPASATAADSSAAGGDA